MTGHSNVTNVASSGRRLAPLVMTLGLSLALSMAGYRLFVDAVAAVIYNVDERTPETTGWAWAWATLWGFGNGALFYLAHIRGFLRAERGILKILAATVLVLDFSLVALISLRGRDYGFTAILVLVVSAIIVLAWRRPGIGGSLLLALGSLLTVGALFGSATYEGEAHGLLYDEDTFAILALGLVPFVCGVLFVVAALVARAKRAP